MRWEFGPKVALVNTLTGKCETAGVWSKGTVHMAFVGFGDSNVNGGLLLNRKQWQGLCFRIGERGMLE